MIGLTTIYLIFNSKKFFFKLLLLLCHVFQEGTFDQIDMVIINMVSFCSCYSPPGAKLLHSK